MPLVNRETPALVLRTRIDQGRNGEQIPSLEEQTKAILDEARMVLPGIQALFGFQLVAIFNQRFDELSAFQQYLHLTALILCAIAMAMVMTPAAYHRFGMHGRVSRSFADLASRLVGIGMAPLALSIGIDCFVVSTLLFSGTILPIVIGGGLATFFICMWFLWPIAVGAGRLKSRGSRRD